MTTRAEIRTWLATASGANPRPPPNPSNELKSTDSRGLIIFDPEFTFAQHSIANGVGLSRAAYLNPAADMQLLSGLTTDAGFIAGGQSLLSRVIGSPVDSVRYYHRYNVWSTMPLYNSRHRRITLSDIAYRAGFGTKTYWSALSFICHPDMAKVVPTREQGLSGFHDIPGVYPLTPSSWFYRPVGNNTHMVASVRLRTDTTVNTDGTWTIAPVGDKSKFHQRVSYNSPQFTGNVEIKLVYHWHLGIRKTDNPFYRAWMKIGNTWQANGSTYFNDNGPTGVNHPDNRYQLRAGGIYVWGGTDANGNPTVPPAASWPPVTNNVPATGLNGYSVWSRGCGIWEDLPPGPGEPVLNEQVMMGWLERPSAA